MKAIISHGTAVVRQMSAMYFSSVVENRDKFRDEVITVPASCTQVGETLARLAIADEETELGDAEAHVRAVWRSVASRARARNT